MRSAGGVTVSVNPETGIINVLAGGTGSLPCDFVIRKTRPATSRLPQAAADSQQRVKVKAPAHSRLPEVATKCIGKCRDDRRAIAAIHVITVPDTAAQAIEERGAIEVGPTVV